MDAVQVEPRGLGISPSARSRMGGPGQGVPGEAQVTSAGCPPAPALPRALQKPLGFMEMLGRGTRKGAGESGWRDADLPRVPPQT